MADTDILLSVDLDTKDALQTAKTLKQEIKKVVEKQGTTTYPEINAINSSSKQAINTIEKLENKLNKLKSEEYTPKFTKEIEKTNKYIEGANSDLEVMQETLADIGAHPVDFSSEEAEKLWKSLESTTSEGEALQSRLEELSDQMNKMYESDTFDIEEFQKVQQEATEVSQRYAELKAASEELHKQVEAKGSDFTFYGPETTKNIETMGSYIVATEEKIQNAIKKRADLEEQEAQARLKWQKANQQAQNETLQGIDRENDKLKKNLIKYKENGKEGDGTDAIAGALAGVTKGVSVVVAGILKAAKKIFVPLIAITLGVRGLMGLLNKLRSMIKEGFKDIYEGDKKLKKDVDALKKSWDEVKANLAAAFMPIVEMAIPYIQKLLDWVNLLISKIAMFIAAIAGQNAYAKAIKKTGDAAKGASKQLSKFDELNNLSSGGGGSAFDVQKLPIDNKVLEMVEKFKALLNEIKAYLKENIFEPFKEGFNSAVGDFEGKSEIIRQNLLSIKDSLTEIFTDPEVQKAQQNFTQAFSKLAGEAAGLYVNTGLNIGQAVTGGIEQFLDENKDEIKEDLTDTLTLQTEDVDKMSGIVDAISKIVDQIGESEPLVSTISNLLSTVYDLLITIEQTAAITLGLLLDLFGSMITNNVDNFKNLLESLFTTFDKISEFIASVASTIKGVIVPLFQALSPLFSAVGTILADLVAKVIELWTVGIAPILNQVIDDLTSIWNDYIDPILKDVVSVVKDMIDLISPLLLWLWNSVLKPIVDWIIGTIAPLLFPIFDYLWSIVVMGIKLVLGWIKMMFDTLKEVVHFVKSILTGDIDGAIQSLQGMLQAWVDWILDIIKVLYEAVARYVTDIILIIKGIWDFLAGFFKTIWDVFFVNLLKGIGTLVENIDNTLAGIKEKWKEFWSGLVLNVINAINNIINTINTMLGNIFSKLDELGIGEWLKEKFSISVPKAFTAIQTISTIPALAQGAVIPPSMGDFIARLGDNNQETEVVSPLSTMKQAMIEALQQAGGVGGDINVQLVVDGNVLADTMIKQNEIRRRQTGRPLFA